MPELKREYRDGDLDILVFTHQGNYDIIVSPNESGLADAFNKLQETKGSKIVGYYCNVKKAAADAVKSLFITNISRGITRITRKDLEAELCEAA